MSVSHRAPARPLILALIAAMAIAALPAGSALAFTEDPATVWINEIHYDNTGHRRRRDPSRSPAPPVRTLTGWTIVRYNGSGGASYAPLSTLSRDLPDRTGRIRHGVSLDRRAPERRSRRHRSRERNDGRSVPQLRGSLHGDERACQRHGEHGHRRRSGAGPGASGCPSADRHPARPTRTSPGPRRHRAWAPRTPDRPSRLIQAMRRPPSRLTDPLDERRPNVATDANIAITFSEPVTVAAPWFSDRLR